MKSCMQSCLVLFGAIVASGHNHHRHVPTLTFTAAPSITASVSETTSTAATNNSTTTLPEPALPAAPLLKQIVENAENREIEQVTDAFYSMFYSGHIQSLGASHSKASEAYNYEVDVSKYNDDTCTDCKQKTRYSDFEYQYKYKGDSDQTCYAIHRSDEGYKECSFEDISQTGTDITGSFVSGAQFLTLSTSFPYFDRYLQTPVAQVFVDGFISFSTYDPTVLSGNTLPNPSAIPYDLIAPYYQSQTLSSTGALLAPSVYYTSDENLTIIQWETNEGVSGAYSKPTQGGAIYQLKIYSSGVIAFAYKLTSCQIPVFTTVQVGIKPLETELQGGYKTSFLQSACQNGGYLVPCPGMSIVLKRVKCSSLIGQTGIVKPKVYKKQYKKDEPKSKNYKSKKQHYIDYFHTFF